MTGFGPSVVRAAAMCGLSFLAAFLGRTYDLMSALCIPALALLWSRPCLLTQASFQLSFLAAGAVAFPGGFLIRRFKARGLFQTLLVSASIQAATAPAVLYHSAIRDLSESVSDPSDDVCGGFWPAGTGGFLIFHEGGSRPSGRGPLYPGTL